jgi:sulfopyruvate decarboxylase subunit beta
LIDSFKAQQLISQHRNNAIVVTTMTTNFEWPQISAKPELDLALSGAMGKASSVGLGLALAQPGRKVIVLDGDGSLLMNLGSLITIANMAPANLIHFVFVNEVYRTTGGQPIPHANKVNFVSLAQAAGYANVHRIELLEELQNSIKTILAQQGPTFVCLIVPPAIVRPPFPLTRTPDIIDRFRTAIQEESN